MLVHRETAAQGREWLPPLFDGIELSIDQMVPLRLDASSGSGDVYVTGRTLDGASSTKGSISGTLGGGGPLVRASTRSGAVKVALR